MKPQYVPREKGSPVLLTKTHNRLRLLGSYFQLQRKRANIEEYLEFIQTTARRMYAPLQVSSEILSLMKLVASEKPKSVLEIGTANGGTLFLLARSAAPDAHLISLDLPAGEFGGGYSPIRIPLYKSFARGAQRVSLIRGNSHAAESLQQVKSLLNERSLDFLLIDGDHTYHGVRQDFELYAPLVRQGGIVALHDVAKHPAGHNCDVDRFWAELKVKYRTFEFIENTNQGWAGIGVVFIDSLVTP